MNFTDSDFMTASEKQRVFEAYVKFVEGGFNEKKFTKDLYKYLSLNFSFIAHFNREGFFGARFEDPIGRIQTLKQIKNCSPWEFTNEPHRNGDLNKAVHEYTLDNSEKFLESARMDRIEELKLTIETSQNELRKLFGN